MNSISAIVPTHRRTELLARTLRSIQAQTAAPVEVIIVNDGPDGDSAGIRASADKSGVAARLLHNQRGAGPSGARNTGADRAEGEWLAFLDDDDEWQPSYLQTAIELMVAEQPNVICCDHRFVYESGREPFVKRTFDVLDANLFLTRNPGLIGSNLIIRRDLYQSLGGFDETMPSAEDLDLGIRLSLTPTARYRPLHEPLVNHHFHQEPRICRPLTPAICEGTRRFYQVHSHRMTSEQKQSFAATMGRLWHIDVEGRPLPSSSV
jgi:glycosyltransferase involved in cell wall biosynthesis